MLCFVADDHSKHIHTWCQMLTICCARLVISLDALMFSQLDIDLLRTPTSQPANSKSFNLQKMLALMSLMSLLASVAAFVWPGTPSSPFVDKCHCPNGCAQGTELALWPMQLVVHQKQV